MSAALLLFLLGEIIFTFHKHLRYESVAQASIDKLVCVNKHPILGCVL